MDVKGIAFCPCCKMPSEIFYHDSFGHHFDCNYCGFHQNASTYQDRGFELVDPRVDFAGRVFEQFGGTGVIVVKDPKTGHNARVAKEEFSTYNLENRGYAGAEIVSNTAYLCGPDAVVTVYYAGEFAPLFADLYTDADGTSWFVSKEALDNDAVNQLERFSDSDYVYDDCFDEAVERAKAEFGAGEKAVFEMEEYAKLKARILYWYMQLRSNDEHGSHTDSIVSKGKVSAKPDTVAGRFCNDRFPKVRCIRVTDASDEDEKKLMAGQLCSFSTVSEREAMKRLGIVFEATDASEGR